MLVFVGLWLNRSGAQSFDWKDYHVLWTSQSQSSAESMPMGGGDIGLNVWAEHGDIFLYLGKTGAFDENNMLLKLGRIRLRCYPNPFAGGQFSQELQVDKGQIVLKGEYQGVRAEILLWVDVYRPNIYIDIKSNRKIQVEAAYESWRFENLYPKKKENNANSWKWAPPKPVVTYKDQIAAEADKIVFYHRNRDTTVFDITVEQQGMKEVKDSLYNPLQHLTSGGLLQGPNFVFSGRRSGTYMGTDFQSWVLKSRSPQTQQQLQVTLQVAQEADINRWKKRLAALAQATQSLSKVRQRTESWWQSFWQRSYIILQPQQKNEDHEVWQVGRNYQLFRLMLACNAYGDYPTKFNGGLFTYDPATIDSTFTFTPDFRNWGGGTHTAQNQRLLYWPLLKSGDFDMLPSQFKFYQRILKNAEWRSKIYWGHAGASFTEQIENFGLPNPAEYNWKRPKDFDKGLEYNAWLEYQWDTVLEFCMMMLETQAYQGADIRHYIPFIESCLRFFDEHYQYRARQRGSKVLDDRGHLVLYPGSSAETYKMAYNASTTIAALQQVTERLLNLPQKDVDAELRTYLTSFLSRIPPLPVRELNGKTMLAPAQQWARINNTESPQLYAVYPWGLYGVGQPNLDMAINTYYHDPDVQKFKSHVGWKQHAIFAARLGLTDEAKTLMTLKLKNAERRFPTFWGPGYDWVPDHNWGGSGMIALQEMLMQTAEHKIYLFPAWPSNWDVDFKLHAPGQTTIQGKLRKGELLDLKVFPKEREADVINMLQVSTAN